MKLTEERLRRAIKTADRRYYDMIAERIAESRTASRKGRRHMANTEHTHHIKKFAVGAILAAAVLGGGGIIAAVAMRGPGGGTHYDYSDVQKELQESSENAVQSFPKLTLTDQQWDTAAHEALAHSVDTTWFIPTEDGIYHPFVQHIYPSDGEFDDAYINAEQDYLQNHKLYGMSANVPVFFTSADTKESTPLCARPNCLHDGSEYCEATAEKYHHSGLVAQDGVIYASAIGRMTAENEWKTGAYLLSYAPDGTALDVLCDFGIDYANVCCEPVVHRGYVWCIFQKIIPNEPLDPVQGMVNGSSSGYVIVGYEIATGKTVEVYSSMPEAGSNQSYQTPSAFTASGDRLFYLQDGGAWPSANVKGIFSVDLVTGEHEKIITENYCSQFTVAGDKVYYIDPSDTNSSMELSVYDIRTGETETCIKNFSGYHIVTDGEMFCIAQLHYDKEDPHYSVILTDLQGSTLGEVRVPRQVTVGRIAVYGDDIYILTGGALVYQYGQIFETTGTDQQNREVLRCSKAAILAGNAEWEAVATLQENIEIDMEAWRAEHPSE